MTMTLQMTMTLDDYNERILKPLVDRYDAEARETLRLARQELIEKIAVAILNSMDITDGLNIISASTYAEAALECIEKL